MNDVVERVARAVGRPLANMTGGCFKPDNGRSERGDCADGDCYCSRVTRHVARAAIEAMRDQFDAGRFDQWQTRDLVAQCRMQARDNLDPEYTQFMDAVANRLAALADASPDIGKEGIGNE